MTRRMAGDRTMFELERFAWGAPDRLELSGRFIGLPDAPRDAPVLVVSGEAGMHRLPVVPDSLSGPPEDGRSWDAAFAWQEAPVAFELAKLEFGADMVVELPEPDAKRKRSRHQVVEVTRKPAEPAGEAGEAGREPEHQETPAPGQPAAPRAGVERLRLQTELLATQATLREIQASLERSQEELTRAREDLSSERELRHADAERFRAGLTDVRHAAEQALTAEQGAARQLGGELRDARAMMDAKDAALTELRGQLEAAVATRTEAESEARAEIDALRERVEELGRAGQEAAQLRAELEAMRTQADGARAQLAQALSSADEARSDAERLLGRLSAVRDAVTGGE